MGAPGVQPKQGRKGRLDLRQWEMIPPRASIPPISLSSSSSSSSSLLLGGDGGDGGSWGMEEEEGGEASSSGI